MLGYYEGFGNVARPIVGKEWLTLHCKDCGVSQTHHKEDGTKWRCVICSTFKDDEAQA